MKKVLLTLVALLALVTTVKAQNIVQVNSGELRQLCVGEGQRAYHKVMAKFCYYKPSLAVVLPLDRKLKHGLTTVMPLFGDTITLIRMTLLSMLSM